MADTAYAVGHPLARKAWAKKLFQDVLKETYIGRFIGKSSNSLIQRKDDLGKNKGDRVTVGLRVQMTGNGVTGDATLEGNEEALVTYHDNVFIDQLRHATRSEGKMSEQRVPFEVREEGRMALTDWMSEQLDTSFMNQIAGNTGQATGGKTGMQATVAPSSTRIIYSDGTHTSEGSLSTTDVFQLTFFDRALAQIKVASPTIRPVRVDGKDYYVAFMHPYSIYRLRTDATANRVTWYDTQKALLQGGESKNVNGIFTGAVGVYNGIVIHESTRVPAVTANVRRTVICGAQSACIAFGAEFDGIQADWVEKSFDYGNKLGIAGSLIWGLKKTIFNSVDFATFVIATRDPAP